MKFLKDVPETITSLREKFAKHCRPGTSEQPALKNICLVGAYNSENGMPWYELDKMYLSMAMHRLNKLDIAIDPEFNIEIDNVDPKEGGKDFLKRTDPADMVVLCFIFNPPAMEAPIYSSPNGAGRFSLSQDHYKKTAWHDAAVRVGAKIIAVVGDDFSSEVGPSVFIPANDNVQFVKVNPQNSPDDRLHILRHRDFNLKP